MTTPDPEVARLRRALERERAARRQAEDIAEQTTARLYRTMQRLEREHQALRDLTAAATHDVKNPLTSIVGFVQLLASDTLPAHARADVAERLVGSTAYMRDLIDGLLDALSAGMRGADRTVVDLGRMLDDAAIDLRARHADVVIDQGVTGWCLANATDVRRLFDNLLENAARYARPAPVRIGIERLDAPADQVLIRVGDSGGGIPAEERSRIFGLFQRGSTAAEAPGSGVGLAVAQRLAQAADGDLWLDDQPAPAGGAAFVVRLPSSPAPAAADSSR